MFKAIISDTLGLSVAAMRRQRLLRQPPAWVKLGGRVLYRSGELEAFINANVVQLACAPHRDSHRDCGHPHCGHPQIKGGGR
jgi:hypothetical protein